MPDIKGVEIFGVGKWNNVRITEETLEEIVSGFEATKAFKRPHLKLGHNDEQNLIAKDGLPAAGWVENVYIKGKKLFADFVDIPAKVFQLIEKGAYKKVSVELFKGYRLQGETHNNLLGAVALLGADFPAVASLNDILARYDAAFTFDENPDTIKELITFEQQNDGVNMSTEKDAEKVKDLEAQLAAAQAQVGELGEQVEEFKTKAGDNDEKLAELAKYKADTDKQIADLQAKNDVASVEKFTLGLEAKDLVSPSMKPYANAFLSHALKADFSVGEEKLDANALLEKLLGLAKEVFSTVNTKEETSNAAPQEVDENAEIQKKIDEHLAANPGATYRDAYSVVQKNQAGQ
jgi:hypothetical protein